MKHQNTEQHQTKIIQLQTSKKRHIPFLSNKIAIVVMLGFFISLSVASNYLFLEEILIATAIISLSFSSKETTKINK
ncbi:hypothetical protein [uncultured Dokdonia sp.]|uniref:hypothetical protein n=1 Tax=uncultured Dokdonia sp. TaxID=575653 RepID=UPI00261CCC1A|nr:hypothetical protein [uncultured Dokdonia sp.]